MKIQFQTRKGVFDMKNLTLLCFGIAALGALALPAGAEPYWYAYEGNDFPENEGWERHVHAGGANRWIEDDALVLDTISVGDLQATETYVQVDVRRPEAGELFVAEWRMRLDQFEEFYDATVGIARPEPMGDLAFLYGMDHLVVLDVWDPIPFAPGEWHEYRFESTDLDSYTLAVDGIPAYSGRFQTPSILNPFFAFGNSARGAASVSRWDYIRFGIVPEPTTAFLMLTTIIAIGCNSRRFQNKDACRARKENCDE